LALLDTLSPTTFGVVVYMLLSEKERLISRLLIYLGTVALLYFIVGIFLMLGLDAIFHNFSFFGQSAFVIQFMFFLGLALLICSFFLPTRPSTKPFKPKSKSCLP